MSLRVRLKKIEETITAKERFLSKREIYWWNPADAESTKFVMDQTFRVCHRDRKYQIRIIGEPDRGVYRRIAREIFPDKEKIRDLSDQELTSYTERFVLACEKALEESRRKSGLPPIFTREKSDSAGGIR